VESCYTPIIQSGGEYDIRVSAQSNNKVMQFDVIICSLGARYRNYCANVARTYLVDPVKKILDSYTTLMTLTDKCLEQMIVGGELKDVMEGAKNYLNKKSPELLEHLPKTLGFAIGLEFRDSTMLLNSTNTTRFEVGMVFNLVVGFQNIPLSEEDKKGASPSIKKMNEFSLLVADTVVIQAEGVPEVLTKSTRTTSDITYNLADDGDENDVKHEPDYENDGLRRSTRGREEKEATERATAHRIQRQKELMEAKIALARRKGRGSGGGENDEDSTTSGTDLNTYQSSEDYPKDTNPYRLKVDMQREAVLVPINGQIVPFHVSTIKNVSMPEPDRASYLRINFYSTGMALGKDVPRNIQHLIGKYGAAAFVKELTFRSLDPKNLTAVYRNILELRKRLRQNEQKKEVERDLVEQDKLIRIKDQRVPQLQDLTMRPQLSGRKSTGALAAHQNGLRFTTTKGEIIDVMYGNIKHAFFQPCETSTTMVLIHFHLKDFILIGKKKQKDIQFYTEVIESSLNLDNQRRSAYDPDELDDEQRERDMKRKLNKTFLEFCKKVEKVAKHYEFNLNYDIPYRDLGFHGTYHREMAYLMPSVSCLVNLTEMPFFVVDISEVDHVHFERVTFATKYFDMIIILKNYETKGITAIEIKYLDQIQDWLSDVQITFTAGPDTFQWKSVMDTVKEDDRFYYDTHADGTPKAVGWLMLVAGTQDDPDDPSSSDEDSEYGGDDAAAAGSDDEDDSDDSDDDDDDESFADEDDESEGEYDDEEDLEEDGKVLFSCPSLHPPHPHSPTHPPLLDLGRIRRGCQSFR
jgi:nucleosome binding factor SPN SPT16 subunit